MSFSIKDADTGEDVTQLFTIDLVKKTVQRGSPLTRKAVFDFENEEGWSINITPACRNGCYVVVGPRCNVDLSFCRAPSNINISYDCKIVGASSNCTVIRRDTGESLTISSAVIPFRSNGDGVKGFTNLPSEQNLFRKIKSKPA